MTTYENFSLGLNLLQGVVLIAVFVVYAKQLRAMRQQVDAARQGAVGHGPHQHVGGLGHQRCEVPECVVRAGRLRHAVMRLGLDGVDQVGELDGILDKEHRNVVADQVVVAFSRVKLDRKAAYVTHRIGGAR